MYILGVEDERRLAQVVRKVLEEEGHTVDVATDGEEGLAMAMDSSHDVIVLDILLPGIDGFEVCRRLRASRVDTPVLLLTALDAVEDRVRGLDAGADDYLPKPFAFQELLARLRALGRRRVQAREPDQLRTAELAPDRPRPRPGGRTGPAGAQTAPTRRSTSAPRSSPCWSSSCASRAAPSPVPRYWTTSGAMTTRRTPTWSTCMSPTSAVRSTGAMTEI